MKQTLLELAAILAILSAVAILVATPIMYGAYVACRQTFKRATGAQCFFMNTKILAVQEGMAIKINIE